GGRDDGARGHGDFRPSRAGERRAAMTGGLPHMTSIAGGTRLDVRVVPRARRTSIEGGRDGRLLIRATAPPVDGAANDATIAALADALHVPRRSVRVVSGASSRYKTVEVASIGAAEVAARLGRVAP